LHFAEIFDTKVHVRIFDVWVNGQLAVSGLDIVALVGHATALVIPVNTTISGNTVSIELVTKIENEIPVLCWWIYHADGRFLVSN
jgi:Malectin domain